MILPLKVSQPGRADVVFPLFPARHPSRFSLHESVLWFDLPRGENVFLVSQELSKWPAFEPGRVYRASWSAMLHGGQAALWWYEFDQESPLGHWTADIHQGHQDHTFRAHQRPSFFRPALQLRRAGHLWLEKIRIDFADDPD